MALVKPAAMINSEMGLRVCNLTTNGFSTASRTRINSTARARNVEYKAEKALVVVSSSVQRFS